MIRDLRSLLVLAGLVLAALPASGQEPVPPLPDRNPARSAQPATDTAASVTEEQTDLPGDKPTVQWDDPKVADARDDCVKLLEGVAIEYEQLDPIKKGFCGAPAPILVKSIGADPAVVISPPATMTCSLAAALATWVKDTVQPAASVLGSTVVKMRNASSYKCRNRYGGANTRISEHALANAFDVSEFVFGSGQRIKVLGNWPYGASSSALPLAPEPPVPNPHRIAATLAVEHATASTETTGAIITVSTRPSVSGAIVSLAKPKTNPFVRQPAAEPLSPLPTSASGSKRKASSPVASSIRSNPFVSPLPQLDRTPSEPEETLQEQEIAEDAVSEPPVARPPRKLHPDEAGVFLRVVHDEACKTFETVLGPAANEAHKDHFHFDMKKRRYVKICDTAVRN